MNHAGRNHALLSASGAHRWMECPASAKLEQQFPDTTSKAAKEGTLAHELCEMKLRHYMFTKDYGKRKLNADMKKMKENPLWSDEMPEYADAYVDYIKSVALGFKSAPGVIIEGRVDFSRWVPEGFGTADCILISGDTLSVIDFKYGKGVAVEAEHNRFDGVGQLAQFAATVEVHVTCVSIDLVTYAAAFVLHTEVLNLMSVLLQCLTQLKYVRL